MTDIVTGFIFMSITNKECQMYVGKRVKTFQVLDRF